MLISNLHPSRLLVTSVGALLFLFYEHSLAIGNFKPTQSELAALPPFCKPRAEAYGNQNDHPEVKHWHEVFGPDWIHMHHYCAGLNAINASYRSANRQEKDNNLRKAIGEFTYTINNSNPNTKIAAEMLMNRGQA